MNSLLQETDRLSWQSATKRVSSDLELKERLLGRFREAHAGWKYLLEVSRDKRVLDYGGGLGAISVSLARSFREVVCLDLTSEKLEVEKRCAEQLGFTNITFVKGGDTPFWPFPEGCFDVVILNGVLNRIPESHQKTPQLARLATLREAYRVLNADGQIYIGIENRFSYKFFLGHKEDSTGLRWCSLLPRKVANVYSLAVRGRPYRTYTHSVWGYKRVLRSAGFRSCRFFVPYPSYRRFSRIVTMADTKTVCQQLKAELRHDSRSFAVFKQRLLKYLAPSFFIIASKRKSSVSFLDQLVDHIIRQLTKSSRGYENARIRDILVSSGKIMALVDALAGGQGDYKKTGFVIKIPLTPYGEHRLEKNIEALEEIWNDMRPSVSTVTYVPRALLKESLVGQRYFVEELMPGVCAENVRLGSLQRVGLMRAAVDILTQLHTGSVKRTMIDEAILERLFIKPIYEVAEFLEYDRESHALNRVTSMLRNMVLGACLPMVRSHGDFSLKNLTVIETPLRITGLIDWDLSRRVGLPLLDLLHLIGRERMVEERYSLHDVLQKYLFPLALRRIKNDLMSNYVETVSIDYSVIPALCIMYWISRVHGHIGSLNSLDRDWVSRNFVKVAEGMSQYLA